METPKWDFDTIIDKDVYEPAEDTFLLLDALESELDKLKSARPAVVMEIGSGSGIVITALSKALHSSVFSIAVDINIGACESTKITSRLNGVEVDVINGDLLESFRLSGLIDVLIFNPPYVQTEDSEVVKDDLSRSWAGGLRGRRVLDKLLPSLTNALSHRGVFYLVAVDYNDVDEIKKRMQEYAFTWSLLKKRQVRGELLYILKFVKD